MIKEIKLSRTKKTKKIKKNNGKRKYNRKNSISKHENIKHTKKHNVSRYINKNIHKNNKKIETNIEIKENKLQEGGNKDIQSKEKFEVKRLDDIDYSQFTLTKYMNSNINWGNSPGPAPMDCCIM